MSEFTPNLATESFEGDQQEELANREARNDLIRSTFEEMYQLDGELKAAEEKHTQPIKDAQKRAWRHLKAESGLTIKNARALYRVMAMDRDSQASEDEADSTQDDLREIFAALAKGGQVNFLDAFEIREK